MEQLEAEAGGVERPCLHRAAGKERGKGVLRGKGGLKNGFVGCYFPNTLGVHAHRFGNLPWKSWTTWRGMKGEELQASFLHGMVIEVCTRGHRVAQGELMVFMVKAYGHLKAPKMLLK